MKIIIEDFKSSSKNTGYDTNAIVIEKAKIQAEIRESLLKPIVIERSDIGAIKIAKKLYKISKQNLAKFNQERQELIKQLVNSKLPNWNVILKIK